MKNLTTAAATASMLLLAGLPVHAQTPQTAPGAPMQQTQPAIQQSPQQQQGQVKVLNNTVCPVSDEAVGSMGPAKIVTHKGYQINLCCNGCVGKFNKNPDAYLQAVLNANQAQPQQAVQPQTQGQPQPQMQQQPQTQAQPQGQMEQGQPQGQMQQAPPQGQMPQSQMQPQQQPQQQGQQNASVKPMNNATCPISGHPVGSMQPGSNIVYKGYQIGLCCDSCKAEFNKNPDQYLQAMLKAGNTSNAAQGQQQ